MLGIGPKIAWTDADLQGVRDLATRPPRDFATEAEAIERYRKVSGLDARFAGPEKENGRPCGLPSRTPSSAPSYRFENW